MIRRMLGVNQYGKAETHLVRVYRDGDVHELRDLLVSVALSGALEAVHLEGDNRAVLATDTQKNTVYAFAKELGVGTPEEFALRLGAALPRRRDHAGAGAGRRGRLGAARRPRVRAVRARAAGRGRRSARADADVVRLRARRTSSCSRPPTPSSTASRATATRRWRRRRDRVLATEVSARWRHDGTPTSTTARGGAAGRRSPAHHSLSLQQTLYAMGAAVLDGVPERARGAAVDAQQAPLRRRPVAVRAGEPERGLPRRRPAVRADRGRRLRDGAPEPGPCWDPYPLM